MAVEAVVVAVVGVDVDFDCFVRRNEAVIGSLVVDATGVELKSSSSNEYLRGCLEK